MAEHFQIEFATEEDLPELTKIVAQSFGDYPIEQAFGNFDTPEARKATGQRHLRAWREHMEESSQYPAIKCVHADPDTGKKTVVGFAEWFIYDRPRTPEKMEECNYLLFGAWLPEETGQEVRTWMQPLYDARKRWLSGRPHAVLMYMCVDKAWRRRGVATMCIQHGLDRCTELGVPAWLEASEEGEPAYRRLGFVEVEKVTFVIEGVEARFPGMIWWPPGWREEDRVAALL
ncbi:hypothetical protein LTR86_009608 [Recurvomyces mirabilis]|nr:hypothetical protein LTR86_009608 [Recurvomyces mirabilis]